MHSSFTLSMTGLQFFFADRQKSRIDPAIFRHVFSLFSEVSSRLNDAPAAIPKSNKIIVLELFFIIMLLLVLPTFIP